MAEDPQELRTLVRRDVAVMMAGSLLAIWLAGLELVGHVGLISVDLAATVAVAGSALLCFGCLIWWASGPRQWLRERYLVLVPVCIAAPAAVLALYDLGAPFAAVVLSAAFGFGAAIAAGLAVASRRH